MKKFILIAALLLLALPGFSLFRAGDIVLILAAANTPGAGDTYWNTDLWITNPNAVNLYLTIEYLPSGQAGNAEQRIFKDWTSPIAPMATLFIPEVIKTHFAGYAGFGALILYGETIDGTAANLLATSRTYTPKNVNDPLEGSYGQGVPGTPWYYYIDADYAAENLNAHWIFGMDQSPLNMGAGFRTNIGFINVSQESTLNLLLELYDKDGAKVDSHTLEGLGPLAHLQVNAILTTYFGITEGSNYALRVTIASSTPENPTYPPALFVYGSKASNGADDPTYLEPTYIVPLDFSCVWP